MVLVVCPLGIVRCLYGEAIDLSELGTLTITRASHVEPDAHGQWWADLTPVGGPRHGPFRKRSQALAAESVWLEDHRLGSTTDVGARQSEIPSPQPLDALPWRPADSKCL